MRDGLSPNSCSIMVKDIRVLIDNQYYGLKEEDLPSVEKLLINYIKDNYIMFDWPLNKNVEDFREISNSLRAEGKTSRANAVDYLIGRIYRVEKGD